MKFILKEIVLMAKKKLKLKSMKEIKDSIKEEKDRKSVV